MRLIAKLKEFMSLARDLHVRVDQLQRALGRIEARQVLNGNIAALRDAEFQVYSQWGEDGILQLLVHRVPIERAVFVEFGVQDYSESNTRFLLQNDNWSGLVLDSSAQNIERIRRDPIYWRHNLKAEFAFITRDNIDQLITTHGMSGDIGILSIDIDGNDYWVWEAIQSVSPRIVVAEYNSLFGGKSAITIPYHPDFSRAAAHSSCLYWGASLTALTVLARRKGYALIGSNRAGNNAFFVRRDVLSGLSEVAPEQCYVAAQFRESRDKHGALNFLDRESALRMIADLPVVDVQTGASTNVGQAVAMRASDRSSI